MGIRLVSTMSLDRVTVERRALSVQTVTLTLPIMPPSTNHLYANIPGKGRVRTSTYESWIYQCGIFLKPQIIKAGRFNGRVDLLFRLEDAHPNRDVSNCIKPLEDLLVKCGAIENDNARFVHSVKAEWAPIEGVTIEIARAA